MANVKLTWDNPSSATDIDEIVLYRYDSDQSATYPDGALTAANADLFAASSNATVTTQNYTSSGVPGPGQEAVDAELASGTYTWGVFSKNLGGHGPGQVITATV